MLKRLTKLKAKSMLSVFVEVTTCLDQRENVDVVDGTGCELGIVSILNKGNGITLKKKKKEKRCACM